MSLAEMPGWKLIHTPGHTSGHVSFFRASDRTLLVGDAFCTTKPESFFEANISQPAELHGPPSYFTSDWHAAKTSVRKLAALEPATVAPGHGKPLAGSEVPKALHELADNFERIAVPADVCGTIRLQDRGYKCGDLSHVTRIIPKQPRADNFFRRHRDTLTQCCQDGPPTLLLQSYLFSEVCPMSKFESNAVTWFEIPTGNIERATSFYEIVLGATLPPWPGSEPCRMFPVGKGGVGGCLVERPSQKPGTDGTLVYLNVDGRLDQVLQRARQNGSTVLVPRTAIDGGFGFYAVITDSEGNHLGLHSR